MSLIGGMVPALSEDSKERGVYTALGTLTGSIGWNGLTVIVVPVVTYFTYVATGKHTQGAQGWLAFAIIISLLAVLCAFIVAWGTEEKDNLIRNAAKQKTTIKDVFIGLAKNDQILWASLAYFMFSFANVVTNGVLYYFFKFVLGKPETFSLAGFIAIIVGFMTLPLYPVLNKFIPRKWLFSFVQCCMITSYLIFIFARENMVLLVIGLVLFNITFAQLVTVLTLTDAIDTVKLRGEGFVTHYTDGQTVKAGDLLLEFDPAVIKDAGLSDNVIVFFTQPKRITNLKLDVEREVTHGQLLARVTIKQG